jgi:hypothetical protein
MNNIPQDVIDDVKAAGFDLDWYRPEAIAKFAKFVELRNQRQAPDGWKRKIINALYAQAEVFKDKTKWAQGYRQAMADVHEVIAEIIAVAPTLPESEDCHIGCECDKHYRVESKPSGEAVGRLIHLFKTAQNMEVGDKLYSVQPSLPAADVIAWRWRYLTPELHGYRAIGPWHTVDCRDVIDVMVRYHGDHIEVEELGVIK